MSGFKKQMPGNKSTKPNIAVRRRIFSPRKSKKNGWLFNWATEFKLTERQVFKLTIRNNPDIVQGLLSISDYNDHYYLHLIESSPFNLGKNKLYGGVPGNLFAFTCKSSWDKGYQGFVSFTSKTRLIEHYEKTLGATHVD